MSEKQIIRVGKGLQNVELPYDEKYPIPDNTKHNSNCKPWYVSWQQTFWCLSYVLYVEIEILNREFHAKPIILNHVRTNYWEIW